MRDLPTPPQSGLSRVFLRTIALASVFAGGCVAQEGTRVYLAHCQQCHDQNSDAHAPLPEALKNMPWGNILKTLETGAMRAQGAQLTAEERVAVARYLGKAGPVTMPPMVGFCTAEIKPVKGRASWNGWSPDERNTRFQPAKEAGMTAQDLPK